MCQFTGIVLVGLNESVLVHVFLTVHAENYVSESCKIEPKLDSNSTCCVQVNVINTTIHISIHIFTIYFLYIIMVRALI